MLTNWMFYCPSADCRLDWYLYETTKLISWEVLIKLNWTTFFLRYPSDSVFDSKYMQHIVQRREFEWSRMCICTIYSLSTFQMPSIDTGEENMISHN